MKRETRNGRHGGPACALPAALVALTASAWAWAQGSARPVVDTANSARPAEAANDPAPTHRTKYEDFRLLLDRNVFNRYRRPPVVQRPRPPETPKRTYTPPSPKPVDTDRYFVLLGVGLEGEQYTAFFEDTRESKILTVQPGQAVGNGKLLAVNLDSIQYERGPARRVIKVGHLLTGNPAPSGGFSTPAPPASRASTPRPTSPAPAREPAESGQTATQPTTAPAKPAAPPADPAEQDILERMRRRRLQETGAS